MSASPSNPPASSAPPGKPVPRHARVPDGLPKSQMERLRLLTTLILDVGTEDPGILPLGVGVSAPTPEEVDLHIKPLVGEHPVDDLLGFTAPDDWWAFGVVTSATARPMTEQQLASLGHPPPADPEPMFPTPTKVLMAVLVPRRGRSISMIRERAGAAADSDLDDIQQTREVPGDPGGRMGDACRRVMGRRTSPARYEARYLAHIVWLERLLREVIEFGNPTPSRARIRALHPMGTRQEVDDPSEVDGRSDADFAALARLGGGAGWPRRWGALREALAAHDETVFGVTPEVAAWMDDGMFQRWIEGEVPPMRSLIRDLAVLVSDDVGETIASVMEDVLDVAHRPSGGRSGRGRTAAARRRTGDR